MQTNYFDRPSTTEEFDSVDELLAATERNANDPMVKDYTVFMTRTERRKAERARRNEASRRARRQHRKQEK